jgi:inhibitor of cysteine peptidase
MIRRSILIPLTALACIAAVILAGCTGQPGNPKTTPGPTPAPTPAPVPAMPSSLGQSDNGKSYTVPPGAVFQLRLPENPTTGFSWNLSVTPGLAVINDTYIPDDATGKLVGSGGTHVWSLETIRPGEQVISGVYRRPWEPSGPAGTEFRLSLSVGEGSCAGTVCTLPTTPTSVPPRYHVYTEADTGKTVEEPLGETFGIRLQENPATGYSWNLSLTGGLTLSGDEFLPPSTGGQVVGGGGTRSFTLVAAGTGDQEVRAEYRRSWVASGTVTYQDLEGGFYGILGDDGRKYEPLDLDARYRENGLRVAFEATPAKDAVSTRMWGTPVNLGFIEEIQEFSLRVTVS